MGQSTSGAAVEIRHLLLIAAIVEHGSITAASRALGVSQSAASQQLRELELKLKAPLFERTARRMVLTPAGEQLSQLAADIVPRVQSFERRVTDGDFSSARGRIRLATECYTAYHWLPPVLRNFRNRWPNVDVRIAPEHTAQPIAALREGALDLAVVYRRKADKALRFEPLFDDELVIVSAPDHAFAKREYVAIEALADEHLFTYSSLTRGASIVRDILDSADVQPTNTTRVQLTEAILELVAAGLGVAILARWAITPALMSGTVAASRIGKHGYSRTWYSVVRCREVTPPYHADLLAVLRRHLGAGLSARAGHLRIS